MVPLNIDIDYLHMLILKVRALMAREETDIPDPGGDAVDDEIPETLQDLPGDLTREEIVEELQGLSDDQLAELVALMWVGRGDGEASDWAGLVAQAAERRETPSGDYLLGEPLLAEYWSDGLASLGYESMTGDTGRVR